MRYFLTAVIALALSACTTTGSNLDVAIQKNLPQICRTATQAHSAFVIAASAGQISQRTINKEAAAWGAIESICADPSSVNTSNALVVAATAYATIALAMREANR